jgi:predicted CopG family antitoxin
MPRPRKHAETIVKSFSLERQVYERLKQALAVRGRSISEEVNELLHKRLAEIEGLEASTKDAQNYDALKREHVKLAEEVNRLIKLLQKDGTYNQLMENVAELGLDTELNNAEEVIAKLMQKWQEDKTALHIFITLIETSKHKKAIERKLEQIRLQQRFSH